MRAVYVFNAARLKLPEIVYVTRYLLIHKLVAIYSKTLLEILKTRSMDNERALTKALIDSIVFRVQCQAVSLLTKKAFVEITWITLEAVAGIAL